MYSNQIAYQALGPPNFSDQVKHQEGVIDRQNLNHLTGIIGYENQDIKNPFPAVDTKMPPPTRPHEYITSSKSTNVQEMVQNKQTASERKSEASDCDMPPPPKRQRNRSDLVGPGFLKRTKISMCSKSTPETRVNLNNRSRNPRNSRVEVNDTSLRAGYENVKMPSIAKDITLTTRNLHYIIHPAYFSDIPIQPQQHPVMSHPTAKLTDRSKDHGTLIQDKENTPLHQVSSRQPVFSNVNPSIYRSSPFPAIRKLNTSNVQKPNIHSHRVHQNIGPRPTEYVSRAPRGASMNQNSREYAAVRGSERLQQYAAYQRECPLPRVPTKRTLRKQIDALSSGLTPESVFAVRPSNPFLTPPRLFSYLCSTPISRDSESVNQYANSPITLQSPLFHPVDRSNVHLPHPQDRILKPLLQSPEFKSTGRNMEKAQERVW